MTFLWGWALQGDVYGDGVVGRAIVVADHWGGDLSEEFGRDENQVELLGFLVSTGLPLGGGSIVQQYEVEGGADILKGLGEDLPAGIGATGV